MLRLNTMFGLLGWFFSPVKLYGGDGGDDSESTSNSNTTGGFTTSSNAYGGYDVSGPGGYHASTDAFGNDVSGNDFSDSSTGYNASAMSDNNKEQDRLSKQKTTAKTSTVESVLKGVASAVLTGNPILGLTIGLKDAFKGLSLKGLGKDVVDSFNSALGTNPTEQDAQEAFSGLMSSSFATGDDGVSRSLITGAVMTKEQEAQYGKPPTVKELTYDENKGAIEKRFTDGLKVAQDKYEATTNAANNQYDSRVKGYQDTFDKKSSDALNRYDTTSGKYVNDLANVSNDAMNNMGRADTDIYSRTKGQYLAGISQAYAEAQQKLYGNLAQRGLAGSGIEAGAIGQLANNEAQQKSQAFGQAYNNAVGMSDQRRVQNVGIQTGLTNTGLSTANTLYNNQVDVAKTSLASGISTAGTSLQGQLSAAQQLYTGTQSGLTDLYKGQSSALASKYANDLGLQSTIYNADTSLQGQQYAAKQDKMGTENGALWTALFS